MESTSTQLRCNRCTARPTPWCCDCEVHRFGAIQNTCQTLSKVRRYQLVLLGPECVRHAFSLALSIGLACLGSLWLSWESMGQKLSAQERTPVADVSQLIVGAERLSEAFRIVAKQLKPSVVTITSSVEVSQWQLGNRGAENFGLPPGFEDLLPNDLLDQLQPRRRLAPRTDSDQRELPKKKMQTGMGSGVIVSHDGFILTNNHVIADSDVLQVELSDGRIFNATVIGSDSSSDVAVLKVDATGLIPAVLGDSAAMEVGDWVLAIGSPFGLDQTVTAGIVSATNRQTGIIPGGYEDFLQTDASINPGNSGGPLVSLRGEVIGVNTAISSRSGTNAGVGFAIPVNMARRIMDDLRREGRVVRGFLGASLGEVNMENAGELQLPPGVLRGALITSVNEGDPAAQANLQAGDVVVAINDTPITSFAQLRNMVAMSRPGSRLQFDVYRNGNKQKFNIVVGELTQDKLAAMTGRAEVPELGIAVERLTPSIAEELGVDAEMQGVLVTELMPGGEAGQLRIRPGDIIVRIDDTDIRSPLQLQTLVAELQQFTMVVQRGSRLMTIRVLRR